MTAPENDRRHDVAPPDRQLGRSIIAIFVLAALAAVLGPAISYRSDVAELRTMLKNRLTRDSSSFAQGLDHYLGVLEQDLTRLADRPEIDPRNGPEAEKKLLAVFAEHNSARFVGGFTLFDAGGGVLWTQSQGDLARYGRERKRWFERLLSTKGPVIEVLGDTHAFLVAVPVIRDGQLVGAIAGLLDERASPVPEAPESSDVLVAVLDANGDLLVPELPPAWMRAPRFAARVEELVRSGGAGRLDIGDGLSHEAAAAPVGASGMKLVLIGDEDALLRPMRGRFLLQMLLIASVQIGAVLFLSLFLQRTYRRLFAMEVRAVQQEKLAALGAAASLIAHEVKNSLNGLNAAVSMLTSGNELPAKTIRGQTDRLKHLATSLLHFGKPASPQLAKTPLPTLVHDAVEGLKSLPETEDVLVETRLIDGHGGLEAPCDPLLLTTAVDNLVRNAIEAAVAAKDLGKVKQARVRVEIRREGTEALIAVEDNAGGVPPEFATRLFEPFATSKPKGIGLGLSMARRAMEQQGGSLGFEPTAEGSRFTIRLPLENG